MMVFMVKNLGIVEDLTDENRRFVEKPYYFMEVVRKTTNFLCFNLWPRRVSEWILEEKKWG